MLVRSRYGAGLFIAVWILVFAEVGNLQISFAINNIANKHAGLPEHRQKPFYIDIVAREYVDLDLLGLIFQPALPIRHQPQAGKQQTGRHW